MAIPGKREEARVGDPYEKLQVTLLDMAHRFEKVRQLYAYLEKREAKNDLDPMSRREIEAEITANVRILVQQSKGFAANRGVLAELQEDLDLIKQRVRAGLEKRKTWAARRKAFEMRTIGVLSLAEAWLEANGLLLNSGQPPYSWLEDCWQRIVAADNAAKRARRTQHVHRPAPSSETAPFDAGQADLEEPEEESDGET